MEVEIGDARQAMINGGTIACRAGRHTGPARACGLGAIESGRAIGSAPVSNEVGAILAGCTLVL